MQKAVTELAKLAVCLLKSNHNNLSILLIIVSREVIIGSIFIVPNLLINKADCLVVFDSNSKGYKIQK